jgi:site-specific DNA recombinase
MIVALYARVSTVKQAEKDLSIPDQVRQMRGWCDRQGHAVAVEYEERGASATDDRRPVFQQMIAEACRSPRPFDAIVVHSLSRFFRDMVEFAVYERRLGRAGVKVLSITQPTGDDFSGEMLRRVISLFDEYQSRENGKHTLRAMKENARRGYFNGARPPFGYRVEAVPLPGRTGAKKRLAVDEAEAATVRKVFALYVTGEHGRELGLLGVARALNARGLRYRGKPWYKSRVEAVLANRAYIGEGVFNRTNHKTGRPNPPADWVACSVPAIISGELFSRAQERRQARHASQIPARVVASPTFLTGLLRCGACGAGMTLATGKGGRYRYYRCGTRIQQGTGCEAGNVPVEKLDTAIRRAVCERVFTEERVRRMLEALAKRLDARRGGSREHLRTLRGELERNQRGSQRLFEAVERGLLPMDGTLTKRAHELQARRDAVLLEIASLERERQLPAELLSSGRVKAFCAALRAKMRDPRSEFGKRYLRLLVEEIRVEGRSVVMRGNHAALAQVVAAKNLSGEETVPRFGLGWLPIKDSNPLG